MNPDDDLLNGLRGLPLVRPQASLLPGVLKRRRRAVMREWATAAAVIAVALLLAVLLRPESSTRVAIRNAELQSRALEAALAAMPVETVRLEKIAPAARLEQRVAAVDAMLSVPGLPESLQRELWEDRVSLLESLVAARQSALFVSL